MTGDPDDKPPQPRAPTSPPVDPQPSASTSPPADSQPGASTSPPADPQLRASTSPPALDTLPRAPSSPPIEPQPRASTSPPALDTLPRAPSSPPAEPLPRASTSPPTLDTLPRAPSSPPIVDAPPRASTSPPADPQLRASTSPPVVDALPRASTSPPVDDEPAVPGVERRISERRAGDRRAHLEVPAPASDGHTSSSEPALSVDEDGWPLDSAESLAAMSMSMSDPAMQVAAASSASLSQMPSPAAAAYEAARIVAEAVGGDIESAGGAALVAAAAAGAAIEVARARVATGVAEPLHAPISAEDAASTDPAVSERLQRDRILRALAEDIGASATTTAAAESAAAMAAASPTMTPSGGTEVVAPGGRASSQSGAGASSQSGGRPTARAEPGRAISTIRAIPTIRPDDPGAHAEPADSLDEQVDPVAIAVAAIARLRERARTDLAGLRVHYHRHDLLVLVIAFIIMVAAGRVHEQLVTPQTEPFDAGGEHGLSFQHSKGWLSSPAGPLPSPRIAHEVAPPSSRPGPAPFRVELTSAVDPTARIEVMIDKKPAWSNIVTGLDLDRRTRWGELYVLDDSSVRSVEDHQWLRTAYRFAHVQDKGDVPRIDRAVEYATIDREQIYVLTFFGTPAEIDRIEDVVAPTLRVATQTGLPLVPQTGHLSTRTYPNAVARAFDSTVMIVVADVIDGKLRARGGGSGVIVGRDGSVLTNYHVIHDQNGRLHDVFVIGRFSEQDKAPQLHCAGKPSRSKLQRELDLALIKCDLDLDGRSWNPSSTAGTWPTLPQAHSADVKIGQRIWVLGYPDVGGGGLTLSAGEVEGWSGIEGAAGRDFLKTDAAIRHGNSGGPVVDDLGRLVGIASAVRTKQTAGGDVVEIVQAGGRVRPIAAATDLLAIAAAGWTPLEGHTDVELQPSAIEAPAEGVQIQSHVLDVVNEAPVRDALVMVLRPGINARTVDVNRLDDQVLSYGRSNAQGEVLLKQPVPVPGTYSLMVVARGYEPMIGDGELTLEASTPAVFDPWGKLLLRAR